MCELMVGLGDADVLGVDETTELLEVQVRTRSRRPVFGMRRAGAVQGSRRVRLVDLPCFGRAGAAAVVQVA